MNENKFWVCIIGMLATAVVIIVITCTAVYHYKVIKMAELGYQAISYPGSISDYYQKVKP